MNMKSLLGAAAVALVTSSPSFAAPIELNFTYGDVSATFYGLDDEVLSPQAATGADFFGVLDDYLGIILNPPGPGTPNQFLFDGTGSITSVILFSGGFFPTGAAASTNTVFQFDIQTGPSGDTCLSSPCLIGLLEKDLITGDLSFPQVSGQANVVTYTTTPVSAVPLPAGGLLLLTGVAGVAALKRRKKRTV